MRFPGTSRRLLAAAVGLLAAGTFGCSATRQTPHAEAAATAFTTTSSPTAAAGSGSFCSVANPTALTAAESAGAITHATDEALAPTAVAPDGSSYFASDGHGAAGMHDIVWVRDQGRQRRTVFTLTSQYQKYGLMGFDSRWLVFMADKSQDITGGWDLYAWDTQAGGVPKVIASDPGTNADSPVEWPKVADGKVTWVQGVGDGTRRVHFFDLATGSDKVVHTGHVGASMFAGGLLLWTEALQENGPLTLAAVTVATGAPAVLPAPLAAAHTAPAAIAGDGSTWAWTSADFRTLYAWQPGMSAAVTVRTVDGDDSVDELGASGDVVTWTGAQATYAADLKTHSYTQITARYGSALVNGGAIAVYYPQGDLRSPDLTYNGYVVDRGVFSSMAGCRT